MGSWIVAAQFMLSLTILVVLHEMGHFFTARWFKCRVDKFYLFFDFLFPLPGVLNFSLFKFKRGDTEYGVGWFPFGGYVSIAGMVDENMNTEQMKLPPQPWEFRSKPAWQRLIILMAGVIVNAVLAVLIYSVVLGVWGERYFANKSLVYGVAVDSVGMDMGFRSGDKIIAVNGDTIKKFNDVPVEILLNKNCVVTVDRGGSIIQVPIKQSMVKEALDAQKKGGFMDVRYPFVVDSVVKDSAGYLLGLKRDSRILKIDTQSVFFSDQVIAGFEKNKNRTIPVTFTLGKDTITKNVTLTSSGKIGVFRQLPTAFIKTNSVRYNLLTMFPAGLRKTYDILFRKYIRQFPLIFSGEVKGYKHIGGFASMASSLPPVWDWEVFWNYTAFLSIVLAFMNLLPIPALDGGHVLFTLAEMITGRKPGIKFLEYAQITGVVIILGLMVFANGNDLVHWLHKQFPHII